jgi:hypothetical protein
MGLRFGDLEVGCEFNTWPKLANDDFPFPSVKCIPSVQPTCQDGAD